MASRIAKTQCEFYAPHASWPSFSQISQWLADLVSCGVKEKRAIASKERTGLTASQVRDELVREQIEKERAALDAKTAKLKALRLAKEAEVKVAAPLLQQRKRIKPSG